MFERIPKFLQFKILAQILDLSNMVLASKYYYSLISSNEFWDYKILNKYESFVFSKPDNLSSKEWYNRINNCGTVYFLYDMQKSPLKIPNIHKVKQYEGNHYYIDVYGNLYFSKFDINVYFPNYNGLPRIGSHDTYGVKFTTEIFKGRLHENYTFENCLNSKYGEIIKIAEISRVKDICPTYIGVFILTFDNELYYIGINTHNLKLIFNNVKSIGDCHSLLVFLTFDNYLFYYYCKTFILIDKNVKSIINIHTHYQYPYGINSIYYSSLDGKNYCSKEDNIELINSFPDESLSEFQLDKGCLIQKGKYIIDTNVILFNDNNSKFYIKREYTKY